MMRAYRQKVIVQKGGRVEIPSSDLVPGTVAEVIVLEPASPSPVGSACTGRLADLIGTCKGMFSSPAEADAFLNQERDAWPR